MSEEDDPGTHFSDGSKRMSLAKSRDSLVTLPQSISRQIYFSDVSPGLASKYSGATVTSNGVTVFLKDDLKRYEPYLNKIKENGII